MRGHSIVVEVQEDWLPGVGRVEVNVVSTLSNHVVDPGGNGSRLGSRRVLKLGYNWSCHVLCLNQGIMDSDVRFDRDECRRLEGSHEAQQY